MTLNQLRCLVACAREADITSAAVKVSKSPSAMLRQIKLLEEELGTELLNLRTRPIAPTLRGEQLVASADHILGVVEEGIEELRSSQNRIVGTLRIALSLSSGHRLVSEILRDFASAAPEVKLDLRDVAFPSQLPQIQRGELDVALLFPDWSFPGVCSETLLHERVTIVMPKVHRLARRPELRLSELSRERWLTFYEPNSGRAGTDFYKACQIAGFKPIIAAEIQSQLVRLEHVSRGEGITILSQSYDPGLARGLVRVPLDPRDLSMPAAIMWRDGEDRQAVRIFLASARETILRIYASNAPNPIQREFDVFFPLEQRSSPALPS